MKRIHVYIDTRSDMLMRFVRLVVVKEKPDHRYDTLLEDGSWLTVEEGTAPAGNEGIMLPPEALPEIAAAIQQHLGNSLPSQAEVSVLREMLKKEQGRVDAVLADATLMPRSRS